MFYAFTGFLLPPFNFLIFQVLSRAMDCCSGSLLPASQANETHAFTSSYFFAELSSIMMQCTDGPRPCVRLGTADANVPQS
jgi:hypothetical protein